MTAFRIPGPLGLNGKYLLPPLEGVFGQAFVPGPLDPLNFRSEATLPHPTGLPPVSGTTNSSSPAKTIAWGKSVTAEFKSKVLLIAAELETNPDFLMAAMAFESAETFSPSIFNAAGSGAVGLIQFMPNTASGLGTSSELLAKMSAVDQLDCVKKYFLPYKGRISALDDLYMVILWPSAVGKSTDYVLFYKDDKKHPKLYAQNKGLDVNADGKITKAEAAAQVRSKLDKGLKSNHAG